MKAMKKTAGFAATAGLLTALFTPVAFAIVDTNLSSSSPAYSSGHEYPFFTKNKAAPDVEIIDPNAPEVYVGQPFAPVEEDDSTPSTPAGGIEHEEQMRKDVKAYVDFMANKFMPAFLRPESDYKSEVEKRFRNDRQLRFTMLNKLLDSCYGEPKLADYAYALNTSIYHAGEEYNFAQKVEAMGLDAWEADGHAVKNVADGKKLSADFQKHYNNSLRWAWALNNQFMTQYPKVRSRVHDLYKENVVHEFSTPDGTTKIMGAVADDAFVQQSRLMIDPKFAEKVRITNETPVQEYTTAITIHTLTDFDHSIACKKPAP
jgi:hypothetical protein